MADYEEMRRRKLEENRRKLDELKLSFLSASLRQAYPTPSPKKRKYVKRNAVSTEGGVLVKVRRSSRVANLNSPDYNDETKFVFLERRRMTSSYRNLDDRVYASDEARDDATERAEKLAKKLDRRFPYFVKSMLQSHVTGGFWLGLPRFFCMTHLPRRDSDMYLIDESGEESRTVYLAKKLGLSAGWRGFAMAHELVDGDALIFQLVKPNTFQVYIIRVKDYNED